MDGSTGEPVRPAATGTEAAREGDPGTVSGEYLGPEVTACQFSLYPLGRADIDTPIQEAIKAVARRGLEVRVANLSTLIYGDQADVFAGVQAAFATAKEFGPAVMVATFASGMPGDELVGRIQESLGGTDGGERSKRRGGVEHSGGTSDE
jgi:uncharacterized protein YqgV (UPF0045/DUF77 family)